MEKQANEPCHEKTNILHMRKQRRRSASRIVKSLYFLNTKFQASSYLLYLYSLVCVGPGRKPERWFSHDAAQIIFFNYRNDPKFLDKQVRANSADPDQTAPRGAV